LASRVDAFHQDATGSIGEKLRDEIERKIEKWQESTPMKAPKALPAPDDRPKKGEVERDFEKSNKNMK